MILYENLGWSNPEFRRYKRLERTLARIVTREGSTHTWNVVITLPMLKKLFRTWLFQVSQVFSASQGTISYYARGGRLQFRYDYKEKLNWESHIEESFRGSFLEAHKQFLVQSDLVLFKFAVLDYGHVICGLRKSTGDFTSTELGILGEYVHLLIDRFELYRWWDLERLRTNIIDRKTMLKELRPKSLYYNILYTVHRVTPCNHSSTILTLEYPSRELSISAEVIRYSKRQSPSIGDKFELQPVEWEILYSLGEFVVSEISPSDKLGNLLLTHVYDRPDMPLPKSVLVVPFKHFESGEAVIIGILLLADRREGYFSNNDGRYGSVLVNTAAPIIYNSLHFAQRLDSFTRQLESELMARPEREENLRRIARSIKKHFAADLCQVFLLDDSENGSFIDGQNRKGTSVLSDGEVEPFRFKCQSDFLKNVLLKSKTATARNLRSIEGLEFSDLVDRHNINSAIATPVVFHNKVLGFIACLYEHSRTFSDFEHYQLESASQQLGAIIGYRQHAQQQLDDLRRALNIMEQISTAETDQIVRDRLVEETKAFLNADHCFISIPDDTGETLIPNARTWSGGFDIPLIRITGAKKDGITSLVANSRQLYVSNDVTKDEYYKDVISDAITRISIGSEMAAPLMIKDTLIGVLDVMSSELDAFGPREETLLQMLLNQSSLAIENARIVREKREHIDLVDALHSRLVGLSAPEEIYRVILETAMNHLNQFHPGATIVGNLYVKRPGARYLEVKAFEGERGDAFSPIQYIGEGIVGRVAETGAALIISDTSQPPEGINYKSFIRGITKGSEISVPSKVGSEVNSVINLESPSVRLFGEKDLEVLRALASEISLAVKFAQLHDQLNRKQEERFYHQELKFLKVISHEVVRSAKNTAGEIPKLKSQLRTHKSAIEIVSRIEKEVSATLAIQERLIPFVGRRSFSSINVLQILHLVVSRAKAKGISLIIDLKTDEFLINGNEDFLAFVFENLIRNSKDAIKNSGKIWITEKETGDPRRLEIRISDDGHGIRPAIVDKIWEPYFTDDGQGKQKGFGLGLWLVRDLVERMNGAISLVSSSPHIETTFMLVFEGTS